MKLLVYLCTRGVACAGPRGRGLCRTVRALGRQPSAAVRVAEALAVLFADLREQTAQCLHYIVDFTYDLAKISRRALFVLGISVRRSVNSARPVQKKVLFLNRSVSP